LVGRCDIKRRSPPTLLVDSCRLGIGIVRVERRPAVESDVGPSVPDKSDRRRAQLSSPTLLVDSDDG
jgi:hypothetical protein